MKKISVIVLLAFIFMQKGLAQFSSSVSISPLTITANTKEKPQSKVWMHDNKHWTLMSDEDGAHVWRLDNNISWTKVFTVSGSKTHRADCKVVGNVVHILLYKDIKTDLVSIEYEPANNTYKFWSERPAIVRIPLDESSETATIDIDSQGRMWLASDNDNSIIAHYADSPYSNWSGPITVASNIDPDDIGAVIALPALNKIGVFWSNQVTKRWGFRTHTDGANPNSWSSDEIPASQSAQNIGNGMADDHLNLKVAGDGTLYCAIKTGYDQPGYPRIALLVRRPSGTWDNLYYVSETGTRGIVVLNELLGKIRIIYTSVEDGGDILYRESAISSIAFGAEHTLITGMYNNPTSIKNNFTNQVVILASTTTTAEGVLAFDVTNPNLPIPDAPVLAAPVNNAGGISTAPSLIWNAAENATSYQLQLAATPDFNSPIKELYYISGLSAPVSGLAYLTKYYWRVRAVNASGISNWSQVQNFTTALLPVPISLPLIPVLVSPGYNETGVSTSPAMNWLAVSNAVSYQLQLATNSNFSNMVMNISDIPGNAIVLSGLAHNTQYFWRVRTINSLGLSLWSSTRKFTTSGQTSARLGSNSIENEEMATIGVVPNPFQHFTDLTLNLQSDGYFQVALHDMKGSLVRVIENGIGIAGKTYSFRISGKDLPAGIYLVKITSPNEVKYLKIMLEK